MIQQRYICDRVNSHTALSPDGELPTGWIVLTTIASDEAAGKTQQRHLDPICKLLLRDFLNGLTVPAL
jgi:hypothetical protein